MTHFFINSLWPDDTYHTFNFFSFLIKKEKLSLQFLRWLLGSIVNISSSKKKKVNILSLQYYALDCS